MDNDVSVIDATRCNARTATGCRHRPPAVTIPGGAGALATDPTAHTTYISSGSNAVSMISTRTCNADRPIGCVQTLATASAGFGANGIAVDRTTHKVYVTDIQDTSVTVIEGTTCNGTDTSGCSQTPAKASVGGYPGSIGIDRAVRTAYVQTIDGISVIPLTH